MIWGKAQFWEHTYGVIDPPDMATHAYLLIGTNFRRGNAMIIPIIFMGTAVWGFLAPFCLNFSFVLMPGWNLRDLVAAICNVYFVVFVCQFIWCFMCLQHFWRLPFEAPVLCLFIKLILVGHWGHFYFGFLPLCFSCVFSVKGRISPEFEPVAH